MSKIYEALRQAELDRAKIGSVESDSEASSQSGSRTMVEEAPAPAPPIPGPGRAFSTLAPVSIKGGRSMAEPSQDPQAALTRADGQELSQDDLARIPRIAWSPLLAQLPALEDKGNAIEQFRSLRSRMQEFRDLNAIKTILISSGLPQEGKSFVAANLAISFARHKASRVLLIDGDMRRATLQKVFGCPQGPGLTEYLSSSASLVEIMQRPDSSLPANLAANGLGSLTFIPSGYEHEKAADLSGNRRFERLIAAVVPYFDWVVVDSSPVNLVSDGVNLARGCDAVVLVARGGVTKYEIAQRAVTELKASKVLGFVLNAVKNPPVAGGYYGYDGYDKIEE